MTPPSVELIFHDALDIRDPGARCAYLDSACGSDDAMRRDIEELLSAYEASENWESPTSRLTELLSSAPSSLAGAQIGGYSVREFIGGGGMGDVYLARELAGRQRTVALKVIKPGMDSRQVVARFERERKTLARMDHPHIAQFIDSGVTEQGRAYFVMELVQGLPITTYCDRQRLPVTHRIKLAIDLCLAVQHAHSKGMLHRDLKPGNVLVTELDGEAVVKVIDFGVAKATEASVHEHTLLTWASQIIGTPLYMSPEQARWSPDVDERADVYALGCLLYELLTGAPPIDPARVCELGLEELRQVILEEDAVRPSTRMRQIPLERAEAVAAARHVTALQLQQQLRGDLDWIALCALAKDRDQRYAGPGELAEDLDRFLTHRVVIAHAPPVAARVYKWTRRHAHAVVTAVSLTLLAVVAIGAYLLVSEINHARQSTQAARQSVMLQTERQRYGRNVQPAWVRSSVAGAHEAMSALRRSAPPLDEPEAVGFEWHYLSGATAPPLQIWRGHSAPVLCADLAPNEKWAASGDSEGNILIWEVATGRLAQRLAHGDQEITSVKFSPDGQWLATAGMDQVIRLWNASDWTEVRQMTGHTATICEVDWSPDSERLASGGRDGVVHIWDAATGRSQHALRSDADVVRCVAWSPDGRHLASGNGNYGVNLWDVDKLKRVAIYDGGGTRTLAIEFSARGDRLAFGGYGRRLTVVDVKSRQVISVRETFDQIRSLRFADNQRVVAGFGGGLIEVMQNGTVWTTEWLAYTGSDEVHREMLFIDHGKKILVACERDQSLKLMDGRCLVGGLMELSELRPMGVAAHALISATRQRDGIVVTDVSDGSLIATLPLEPMGDCPPAYCRKTSTVAVTAFDGRIHLIDSHDWHTNRVIDVRPPPLRLSFSHDGRYLAGGCADGQSWVRDMETDRLRFLPTDVGVGDGIVAFSPTENVLVRAARDGSEIVSLRAPTFHPISRQKTTSSIRSLRVFPDGSRVVAGQQDAISIHQMPELQSLRLVEHLEYPVDALSISNDGRTLAAVGDAYVGLWDADTGSQFFALHSHAAVKSCWSEFVDPNVLAVGSVSALGVHMFGRPLAESSPTLGKLGNAPSDDNVH